MIDLIPGPVRRRCAFLFLLALLPGVLLHGQNSRPLFFERLMPRNLSGQSFPLVHSLVQDSQGFIWITGPYGLARFDGNDFLFFRHSEEDPGSISDDNLFNVFEDSGGGLWVTSDKGLDLLDRKTGKFLHFRHDPADPRSLSSNRIRAICEDGSGGIWVGTVDGGVSRMDPETREFVRFLHDPYDSNSPGSDSIWALCCARDGRIWVGATESGIDCYDPERRAWSHYPYRDDNPDGPSDWHYWVLREGGDGRIWIGTNEGGLNRLDPHEGKFVRVRLRDQEKRRGDYRILSLCEDRDGILWIGTDNTGLIRLDPESGSLSRYLAGQETEGGLSHDSILSIIEDREGLLWFGTARGISVLNKKRFRFHVVRPDPAMKEGLPDGEVLSLHEDSGGLLWIGTAAGGLGCWDRDAQSWALHDLNPEFLALMRKVRIQAITEDDRGDLWFGTTSGLVRYRRPSGSFTRYRNWASTPSILPSSNVTVLLPGYPGFLWAGTRDGGFFEWDIAGEKARVFPEVMGDDLLNSQINSMHVDRGGHVWIGTQWRGIVRFDPGSLQWREYRRRPEDSRSLPSSTVYAIAGDRDGRIWVGTQAGPCLFDAETEDWLRLADDFRLPDSPVTSIVPDEDGCVWLGSEEDLIRIHLENGLLRSYGPEDGLQGGRFCVGAGIRCRDGEIVFGSAAGLTRFFGSEIIDNPYLPRVAVTSIDLSSPPGRISLLDSPEKWDIPMSRLPVTIYLTALSYSHPERNRFRVRVPSLEDRVFELGTNRAFRLDALKSGPNRFVFYASNHDGVWNPEGLALTLRMTIPFWESWTWRAILAVLIAISFWLWLRRRRRFFRRQLLHQIGQDLDPFCSRFDLTKREQEILGLILQGKSNRDIETELYISNKTVKNHVYNLYQKLGVKSRLELANAVRDFAEITRPPEG